MAKHLNIILNDELSNQLENLAKIEFTSKNSIIRKSVAYYYNKNNQQKKIKTNNKAKDTKCQ